MTDPSRAGTRRGANRPDRAGARDRWEGLRVKCCRRMHRGRFGLHDRAVRLLRSRTIGSIIRHKRRRPRWASSRRHIKARSSSCAASCAGSCHEEGVMSTYKVIEVIGTSATSWEDAAAQAVKTAGETLHDLRVAEVVGQDVHLDEGGGITFRTKLQLSFKYEHEH